MGLVTMINPCPVKGSDNLTGVARRCPDLNFLVLSSRGIGENPQVKRDLEALPNVKKNLLESKLMVVLTLCRIHGSTRNMESIWNVTQVLLMPSLWCKA
jgi:hypothetical protein